MINTVNQGSMNVNMNPYSLSAKDVALTGFSGHGTYRGFGSNWFNAENIAKEDWIRAEQAQNNQLSRDLYFQSQANAFNAAEAQKARDYDREMSSTQYKRAVADMKSAGLNPVLALGGSGASFHGTSAASSGGSRSSSGNVGSRGGDTSIGNVLGSVASIIAGLYTAGASNATKLAVAGIYAGAKNRDSTKIIYHDKNATNISKYYH